MTVDGHAKLSGLDTTFDLRPAVEVALDCFGPERLICGSDWPVMLLTGDYDRVWNETREVVAATAPGHVAELLGENARRIYRFEED